MKSKCKELERNENRSEMDEDLKKLTDLPYDSLLEISSFFGEAIEIFNFLSISKLFNQMQFSQEYPKRLCPNVSFFLNNFITNIKRKIPYVLKASVTKFTTNEFQIFTNSDLVLIPKIFPNLVDINLKGTTNS